MERGGFGGRRRKERRLFLEFPSFDPSSLRLSPVLFFIISHVSKKKDECVRRNVCRRIFFLVEIFKKKRRRRGKVLTGP